MLRPGVQFLSPASLSPSIFRILDILHSGSFEGRYFLPKDFCSNHCLVTKFNLEFNN